MSLLDKIKKLVLDDSFVESFVAKIEKKRMVRDFQIEKFNKTVDTKEKYITFVNNVIAKYNSDKYRNHYYNRGFEPPEDLYWLLHDHASCYGRTCSDSEYEKYGNYFVTSMYYINGYYICRMDGQGSIIKILNENE